MEIVKKNWVTILMSVGTVVLAVVAIFTATRLYQLRNQTVAPNVPQSEPAAAGAECSANTCEGSEACLSYVEQSEQQCGTGGDVCQVCSVGQVCSEGVCVVEQTSCEAVTFSIGGTTDPDPTETATPTLTPTPTATSRIGATTRPTTAPTTPPSTTSAPTAAPTLPDAGVGLPAMAGVGAGAILVILGLLLAL